MIFSVLILFIVIGWLFSMQFHKKKNAYSKAQFTSQISILAAAQQMLVDYGVDDVTIINDTEKLPNHYEPSEKTINLSQEVGQGKDISSLAIALHECGYAVLDGIEPQKLRLRTRIITIQEIGIKLLHIAMIIGFVGIAAGFIPYFSAVLAMCIAYLLIVLASFFTLSIASKATTKVSNWLQEKEFKTQDDAIQLEAVLHWAAKRHHVAAVAALFSFFSYLTNIVKN